MVVSVWLSHNEDDSRALFYDSLGNMHRLNEKYNHEVALLNEASDFYGNCEVVEMGKRRVFELMEAAWE